MHIRAFVFSVLFMFPLFVFAGIEGLYHFYGHDPFYGDYRGTLEVCKDGENYDFIWYYDCCGGIDTGTGVRKDHRVSVVFNSDGYFGTILYKIDGGMLKGPWAYYDTSEQGCETANRIDGR